MSSEPTIATLPRITREELSAELLKHSENNSISSTDSSTNPTPPSSDASSMSPAPAEAAAAAAPPSDAHSASTTTTAQSSSSGTLPSHIAIIDVRDSDHAGGHIKGSTWVPSSTLDYKAAELVRTLKGKEVVVFHCALSQQRGPSAALRYLREKRRVDGKRDAGEGEGEKEQKVVVLQGGFTEWQEKYGTDTRLTEGYQKDIWEFGY